MLFFPHYNALLSIRKMICRSIKSLFILDNHRVTLHLAIFAAALNKAPPVCVTLSCAVRGSRMWLSVPLLPVTPAQLHKATCPGFLGGTPCASCEFLTGFIKEHRRGFSGSGFSPTAPSFLPPLPPPPSLSFTFPL